jgi:hypothetical protein
MYFLSLVQKDRKVGRFSTYALMGFLRTDVFLVNNLKLAVAKVSVISAKQ